MSDPCGQISNIVTIGTNDTATQAGHNTGEVVLTKRQIGQRRRRERSKLDRESKRVPCRCGCGELAQFGRVWMSGHNVRSPEEKLVRRDRFLRLWREGRFEGRRVWSEGLTKETDERLAATGRKISAAFTDERRERYRRWAKENGIMPPTLKGCEHPKWKGGVAELGQMIRSDGELYRRWRLPILRRDGFRCVRCGSKDGLNVHHDIESMSSVFRKFVPVGIGRELTFDEKKSVTTSIVDYHVASDISGVTLCRACHLAEHARPDRVGIMAEEIEIHA